jgi:hypothetical protein
MQRFKRLGSAQTFLGIHAAIFNIFNVNATNVVNIYNGSEIFDAVGRVKRKRNRCRD